MKTMRAMVLAALVAAGGLGLFGAEQAVGAGGGQPVAVQAAKPAKDPVKQLRGKLLYERSRMRKLEREAVEAHDELAKEIREMDARRETLYVKFQPKLAESYAREKELLKEIDAMTGRK